MFKFYPYLSYNGKNYTDAVGKAYLKQRKNPEVLSTKYTVNILQMIFIRM